MKRLACIFTLCGACSWSTFDNLSGQTWVDSAGPPKGTDTTEFGANMAAGGLRPVAGGMLLFVTSRANPDFSTLTYDANGIVSQADAGDIATNLNFTTFDDLHPATVGEPNSATVAVAITTQHGVNSSDKAVNTKIVFYDTSKSPPLMVAQPEPSSTQGLAAPKIASGFAFGDFSAKVNDPTMNDPAVNDVVIARDDQVMILTDWSKVTASFDACVHDEPTSFSVALADVDSTNPGQEILLATGPKTGTTGPSKIKIFDPGAVLAYGGSGPAPDCFGSGFSVLATIDKSSDNVVDLGKQMLVTDFGTPGSPLTAIVATAPAENKLYIFTGEDLVNEIDVQPPANAGEWGDSLAIGDLDGDGVPEVAIGAPKSTEGGVSDAGAVFIYSWNGNGLDLRATVYDAQPQAEQHFGQSVAIVPYGTGTQNVLVAGADNEVFTYFHLAPLYDDVRAGHQ